MPSSSPGKFAVQAGFWRQCLDWVVRNVPWYFHPVLVFLSTAIFFVVATSARRTVLHHLTIVFPRSSAVRNYVRAFTVFQNFAWTLTDAALKRLLHVPFDYEVEGREFLNQLATVKGAIVLTAHMGNYDLGASVFVDKFQREIRMVRAPEPDASAAAHVDRSLAQASGGAVKVEYATGDNLLSFDLLGALRRGEVISLQGDRAMGKIAQREVMMLGHRALLPSGPFVLALAAEVPIYPLFVVRTGYRRYRIIARAPFSCPRTGVDRNADIASGAQKWADELGDAIRQYWRQWHAFTPVFQ